MRNVHKEGKKNPNYACTSKSTESCQESQSGLVGNKINFLTNCSQSQFKEVGKIPALQKGLFKVSFRWAFLTNSVIYSSGKINLIFLDLFYVNVTKKIS